MGEELPQGCRTHEHDAQPHRQTMPPLHGGDRHTVAGPSSEPASPPYVGRCKRGAICRFQHDAPGVLPAKDIPCGIEKCKGKGCNYKAPHGKM